MNQPLMTINEVSTFLKVSDLTIERLIKAEKLSASKIGKQWRISQDQLQEYVDSRTIKSKKIKHAVI